VRSSSVAAWIAAPLAAALVLWPATAFGVRITARDRAATHAYLQARYAYTQAVLANVPAADAAKQLLAQKLEGECPGVLSGAPGTKAGEEFEPSASAKSRGEEARESRQVGDLQFELSLALDMHEAELDATAARAFAHTVGSLRWSSPAVTAYAHALAGLVADYRLAVPPEVCADMHSWVLSGYKTLSAGTKAALTYLDDELAGLARGFVRNALEGESLLETYEQRTERALARRVTAVERELARAEAGGDAVERALEDKLGLVAETEVEEEIQKQDAATVVIGSGRTAAGERYELAVLPATGSEVAPGCAEQLIVKTFPRDESADAIVFSSSSGKCFSRSHPQPPTVDCSEGNLAVEVQTRPEVRYARLRLSNGRRITSPVAHIPARVGGPAGFYYQVVRGPSPVPVSLTEFASGGKIVRTVRLPRVRHCTKPKRTPRRTRTLVRGHIPGAGAYTISAESGGFEFPGEQENVHFNAEAGEGETSVFGTIPTRRDPFGAQITSGCTPSEYAIVLGRLRAPHDNVYVRSDGRLMELHKARIPASFHTRGVLAYRALPAYPTEILVKTPAGRTVARTNLAAQAREAREYCEGESEGP